MFFFFKRKNKTPEQDYYEDNSHYTDDTPASGPASRPTEGSSVSSRPVTRVGSAARLSRERNIPTRTSYSSTSDNYTKGVSTKDPSFDERLQAARARLQAQQEARKAAEQKNRDSGTLFKRTIDPSAEQRLSRIGLPADKASASASVRAGYSRNPDVVPAVRRSTSAATEGSLTDMQYHRFAAYLQEKTGIVLGNGKQYLVSSRLTGLLARYRCDSIDRLLAQVFDGKNQRLIDDVVDAMTTNETLWFRDTYPYLALQNIIIPDLVMRGTDRQVRIWSAACSSGQEPYSIAITIQEMMGRMVHIDPSLVQIIGTDLSTEMLQRCREGLYDAHALSRGLSAERRAKFFKPTHNPALMRIDPRLSRMVEFRPLNLLGSFALMGRFDVIFCRNVLIYFNNDVKCQILKKFVSCLNPGGYLILGSTETVSGVAEKFEMLRCNPGIIYKLRS